MKSHYWAFRCLQQVNKWSTWYPDELQSLVAACFGRAYWNKHVMSSAEILHFKNVMSCQNGFFLRVNLTCENTTHDKQVSFFLSCLSHRGLGLSVQPFIKPFIYFFCKITLNFNCLLNCFAWQPSLCVFCLYSGIAVIDSSSIYFRCQLFTIPHPHPVPDLVHCITFTGWCLHCPLQPFKFEIWSFSCFTKKTWFFYCLFYFLTWLLLSHLFHQGMLVAMALPLEVSFVWEMCVRWWFNRSTFHLYFKSVLHDWTFVSTLVTDCIGWYADCKQHSSIFCVWKTNIPTFFIYQNILAEITSCSKHI